MTTSILGPAPIVDFDGTLAYLPVDWAALRARLDVEHIAQLWQAPNPDAWSMVRDAEIAAAGKVMPVEPIRADLECSSTFAVLTSNSEASVVRFLERFTSLRARAAIVVGRETLAGPKHDYEIFRRGLTRCVRATARERGDDGVVYVGDTDWELDFARRLGARVVAAHDLSAGP